MTDHLLLLLLLHLIVVAIAVDDVEDALKLEPGLGIEFELLVVVVSNS